MTFWQAISNIVLRFAEWLGQFSNIQAEEKPVYEGVDIRKNSLGADCAYIDLNKYKGKTIKGNMNDGKYLPIYAIYFHEGHKYVWFESQGYYDPLSGNCVTWFDISDIFGKNIKAIICGEWQIEDKEYS